MRVAIYAPGAPPDGDVVVIPPALSGGPTAEALDALRGFARAGGRLLGLGDGAAWLCAAALLPGGVTTAPPHAASHVRVEGRATAFTWAIPAGRILGLAAPAPPTAGFVAHEAEIAALESRGQIVLRYCDAAGGVDHRRGRAATVAGLSDETGRVLGLLAPSTSGLDDGLGRQILACLRARAPRVAAGESSPDPSRAAGAPRASPP
ncbi:MAG TPA: hypothetical protein VHL80_08885 [Polyangia bacterium]|nr:hypothetical protein [Polyangia bacterium]